jgi:hypothetical protein
MQNMLTSHANTAAGSAMHTAHNGRSLVELRGCIRLRSLEVLDMTGCAALVAADLAGCESLQTVKLDGCTGLRELSLPT